MPDTENTRNIKAAATLVVVAALCYSFGGYGRKTKEASLMKKDKEYLSKSAAYKSRTYPPRYFEQVNLDGKKPENTIEWDSVIYDKTDHIPIDIDAIPDHVREELARATLEYHERLVKIPGMAERLGAITEARKNKKISPSFSPFFGI